MTDAIAWHSSIAQDFDAKYAASPAFRERFAIWSALIERYVNPQSQVLDAGCGSGVFSAHAAKTAACVLGFDSSEAMVALVEGSAAPDNLGNCRFEVAAPEYLGVLGTRRFDLILCSSVLADNLFVIACGPRA